MTPSNYRHQGLFVGLTTLDLIYHVTAPPKANQKLVASDYILAAGGPATNAAIAFQYLSQQTPLIQPTNVPSSFTTLLSVLGAHPISQIVRTDVAQWGVAIADLNPTYPEAVSTSSIMVTAGTGERAVVSLNAVKCIARSAQIPDAIDQIWDQIGIVLMDGHQMEVGEAIAHRAHQDRIPVVIDGGSWKPGFEKVLPYATYVICSANFYPPACKTSTDVHQYLQALDIPHVAITHGSSPIAYWHCQAHDATCSFQTIPVPAITPVDTLGAGDIFHGAFCYYLLEATQRMKGVQSSGSYPGRTSPNPTSMVPIVPDIPAILSKAAQIASTACTLLGPREWMKIQTSTDVSHVSIMRDRDVVPNSNTLPS